MLTRDGRCKTLDAAADGYVRSEACVTMHLGAGAGAGAKCSVRGTAVNQDGRSSSLTAPNGPSQIEVLSTAAPAALAGYDGVQLHGTGTALGDPIEIGALLTLWGAGRRERPVVLRAVKSAA